MTEEVKTGDGEVVTPKEPEGKTPPRELSAFEQEQVAQGWKPEWEWDGDPAEHRSAREFKDRGELLSKIKSQSDEIRGLRNVAGALSEHNKKVFEAGYHRAIADLNAQKAKAIADGKGELVVALDERIGEVKDQLKQVQAAPTSTQAQTKETPAFGDFKNRNPWYTESKTMRHWAHGEAIDYANNNPNASEEDVYRHMEKMVKQEFPHKFQRQSGAPPGPDSSGSGAGKPKPAGSGDFDKLMNTLPEDQARVAKDMVKRGLITKEKYVSDYNMFG